MLTPTAALSPAHLARLLPLSATLAAAILAETCQLRAQEPRPRILILGERVGGYDSTGSARVDSFDLRNSPRLRLDDTLRAVPGFSLFRRSGSLEAQPTTQGVSLRNIAPSGSGRSLILLDGIPQNDPFGGWIYWSRLPSRDLAFVELSPGCRPGPFGGSAMAGTVRIHRTRPALRDGFGGLLALSAGGRETVEGELLASAANSAGRDWLDLRVARFESAGQPLIAPDFRGAVDIPAWSDALAFDMRGATEIGNGLRFGAGLGFFEERRGNGTPLTGSTARGADLGLTLERPGIEPDRPEWRLLAFAQTRQLQSTFSAVAPGRNFETPSLDQFEVPSAALGLAIQANGEISPAIRFSGGADARFIEGETNERFRFIAGRYNALREAGGNQMLAGGFGCVAFESGPIAHQIGARLDFWQNGDARRIEKPLGEESEFRGRVRYPPDAAGIFPSARWDLTWRAAKPLAFTGAAYVGGRVPTLNELHRPFRVRDEVTESNPLLDPEELRGLDIGVEIEPGGGWRVSSRLFFNELRDGVGNITLGRGPFDSDAFGFVPAGTSLRQKRNIPLIEIRGLESAVEWAVAPGAKLVARHLFLSSAIAEGGASSDIEGLRPAQVPRHQLQVSLALAPARGWEISLHTRAASMQYDDDLNRRPLAGYAALDARIGWNPAPDLEIFIACENLFDSEIETGKTALGEVAISGGRLLRCGFSRRF